MCHNTQIYLVSIEQFLFKFSSAKLMSRFYLPRWMKDAPCHAVPRRTTLPHNDDNFDQLIYAALPLNVLICIFVNGCSLIRVLTLCSEHTYVWVCVCMKERVKCQWMQMLYTALWYWCAYCFSLNINITSVSSSISLFIFAITVSECVLARTRVCMCVYAKYDKHKAVYRDIFPFIYGIQLQ